MAEAAAGSAVHNVQDNVQKAKYRRCGAIDKTAAALLLLVPGRSHLAILAHLKLRIHSDGCNQHKSQFRLHGACLNEMHDSFLAACVKQICSTAGICFPKTPPQES